VDEVLRIVGEVAEALDYAHGLGVIHRDIKPENIMLEAGGAVVADFGIAKALDASGSEHLTETGIAVGTPWYMSPEQAAGEGTVDGRSDVYALGCVAYEMLGGSPPFTGPSPQAVLARHSVDPVPSLRTIRPSVTAGASQAIERALSKVPADRYPDAGSFRDALAVAQEVGGARALSALPPVWQRVAAGLAVLILAVVAGSVVFTFSANRGPPRLVVLPFENLGPPDDAHFSAGLTDVVTARLAGISGLQVISRASAVQYAGTELRPRQIGRELGVDYILGGTVQRERPSDPDSRVRITPQLIRANDDTSLWAETYDDLMSGMFALQSDLAERVAAVLEVALLDRERQALAAPPTQVPQAYELYVTASGYGAIHEEQNRVGVELLERALQLDSTFAEASALLSSFHAYAFLYGFDRSPARLARAREAAERALAVDPGNPNGHRALGRYFLLGHRDYERALQEYSLAEERLPNDDALLTDIAYLQRRRGDAAEAALRLERAAVLNPSSPGLRWQLGLTYGFLGRYAEAAPLFEESISMAPDVREPYVMGALNYLLWDGRAVRARAILERMPEAIDPSGQAVFGWYEIALLEGSLPELLGRIRAAPVELFQYQQDLMPKTGLEALISLRLGDTSTAKVYADSARVWLEGRLAASAEDPRVYKALGLVQAVLGNADEAVRAGERAVELEPVEKDAMLGPYHVAALAEILVLVGNHGSALDQLERLTSLPAGFVLSPAKLTADPRWDALRDHPRFQALLERYREDVEH
jgi:serine/threonine-protein kinase